jgi:beta-lactamase regulating signal transducer with metallopeptidase domain
MIATLNEIAGLWWNWIAETTVQGSLLIGFAFLADRLWRRWMWPEIRLAVFLLVLLKFLLPPSLSSPLSVTRPVVETIRELPSHLVPSGKVAGWLEPAIPRGETLLKDKTAMETVDPAEGLEPSPAVPPSLAEVPAHQGGGTVHGWTLFVAATWAAVTAGLFIFRGVRRWIFGSLLASCPAASEAAQRELEKVCRTLGIQRRPRLVISDRVRVPALSGLRRPVILLPEGWGEEVSGPELEHILLHEAAHLRRRDLWLQEAVVVVHLIFWFNPLLWLVRRRIRHLVELCCDRTVGQHLEGPVGPYRRTLLLVYGRSFLGEAGVGGGICLVEGRTRLGERLRWLERHRLRRPAAVRLGVTSAALLLALLALPMADPAMGGEEVREGGLTVISLKHFLPAGRPRGFLMGITVDLRDMDGWRRQAEGRLAGDNKVELVSLSAMLPKNAVPGCETVRSMPGLLGEGSAPIAGYSTLVVAVNGPGFYAETYYAPALGCQPLLEVMLDRTGLRMTRTIEVIPGDPPREAFEPGGEGPARARIEEILTAHSRFPAVAGSSAVPPPAPGPGHGQIGPGGTFFLGGQVPDAVLRTTAPGVLERIPVPLGGRPIRDREMALDALGRLYVLLPDPADASAWWGVRRFEGLETPVDLSLRPSLQGLIDFQVDGSGNLHFLVESGGEPVLLTYSADGHLERSRAISRLEPHSSRQGPCRRPPLGLARLALTGDGTQYLLFPRLRMVSGGWMVDGDLFRLDPARQDVQPLTVGRPGRYLTEIFSSDRGVILAWTEPHADRGGDSPFPFSASTARWDLELLDRNTITPLAQVTGRLLDAASAGALVELPGEPGGGQTRPILSFVPFFQAPGPSQPL